MFEFKYIPVSSPKWLGPGSDNDVGPRPHGDERPRQPLCPQSESSEVH